MSFEKVETDGKIYAKNESGALALVAADQIVLNVHRDVNGSPIAFDATFKNSAYTGFGSVPMPTAIVSSYDIAPEVVSAVLQSLTPTWLSEYVQNQIFEVPQPIASHEVIDA